MRHIEAHRVTFDILSFGSYFKIVHIFQFANKIFEEIHLSGHDQGQAC